MCQSKYSLIDRKTDGTLIYSKKEINNCFNIIKFFACIGVVFIHVPFPGILGIIVKNLSAFAVPFFYMIAGYYSFGCNSTKIKKRLFKILKIFLIAYCCFFIFYSLVNALNGSYKEWLVENFSWKTPFLYLVFCTVSFAIPLWYLIAMAETYCTWLFIVRVNRQALASKLLPLLMTFGVVLTIVCESLNIAWFWKINFLGRSLPWFLLGYTFNDRFEKLVGRKFKYIFTLLIFTGWVVSLIPVVLNTTVQFGYIGTIVTSISIFCIGLENTKVKINKLIEYISCKLSLFIYIFHPLVSKIILIILLFFHISVDGMYQWIHPILTACLTIIISDLFFRICNKLRIM